MYYKVSEWIYDNPVKECNYLKISKITPAIRQAIINDIRINNYFFSYSCGMLPLLNTGEVVDLDDDIVEELVCEAYNIDHDLYTEYLYYVENEPDISDKDYYETKYQMKKVVWVTDDVFDKLKEDLFKYNKNNFEIIPNNYINLKENDVIIFACENRVDYFELNVKKIYDNEYYRILDTLKLKEVNSKSIFNLYNIKEPNEELQKLSSRFDGLSGKQLYDDFKKTYGTWFMLLAAIDEFDCQCDILIFDKNVNFKRTILEEPPVIPLDDKILKEMQETYNRIKADEMRLKEEKENHFQQLKEKIRQKINSRKESTATVEKESIDEDIINKSVEVDVDSIPFVTLDNISNYFSSEKDGSVETLIESAKKEYELSLKNEVIEKRLMLLNNVCIFFNKINDKEGTIPNNLFFNTKKDLLNIYMSLNNLEKVSNFYNEIKEFYNSLDNNTKSEYQIKYTSLSLDYVKYLNSNNEFSSFMEIIDNIFEILYENESDEALIIKSNCHSLLSTIYFEAQKFDEAIDYAYTALVLTNQIENKTEEIKNQYAIFAFNLGNIFFQCDKYDNAITLFKSVIDFSKEHSYESKLMVFTYSSNYLAQVYVCLKEYEKAIEEYKDAISYLEENFSNNEILNTKIDFLQRISIIYDKYLFDQENSSKYEVEAQELKKD